MKKLFTVLSLSCAMVMLFGVSAFAQQVVSGKVTDASSNEALVGAKVVLAGSNIGAYTGADGTFKLNVPTASGTLQISYLGYVDKTFEFDGEDKLDIKMETGAFDMDEVVVVGYGTVKKRDLTGAVSSVNADDFNQGMIASPDQAIQGKVPGVYIIANSGQPGAGASIRIRGNASIRTGNNPLWVLDGVPLDGRDARPQFSAAGLGTTPDINPMVFLNPNDIANIDVLKDASATAIYGSRGANGVIMVTTKKGRSGPPKVTFNASAGVSNLLKRIDVLDGDEYRAVLQEYNLGSNADFGGNEDALDAVLRTAISQNYHTSISGGSKDGSYRIGMGYFDQQGIVDESGLKKFTGNLGAHYGFLDNLFEVDVNLFVSQVNEDIAPIANNSDFTGNLIGQALQWFPTRSLTNPDGSFDIDLGGSTINPLAFNAAYNDVANVTNFLGTISPSINFTDDLSYKFSYSVTNQIGTRRTEIASWINLQNVTDRGLGVFANNVLQSQQFTHTLNYNKNLTESISLNAVAGYEYLKYDFRGTGFGGQDFITDELSYLDILGNSSQESRFVTSFANPTDELQSYFARVGLNLNDRYLVTATVRADGSSKFGENNKYGVFPSLAAAWNIHNEDFLAGGAFDVLKVRIGWGQNGNREFPPGAAQERYGFGGNGVFSGLQNVANPDLRWETSTTINAGLDFSILKSRLVGSIDYFNKNTTDILFQFETIQPAPTGRYWINLPGNIINSGVELGLNAFVIGKENLNWEVGVNAAFLQNKLTNYTGPNVNTAELNGQGISGAAVQRLENDKPINSYYLRTWSGLDDSGLDIISDEFDVEADPNPDLLLGFNTKFNAGKFGANLSFFGAFGHQLYNNTANTVTPIGNLNSGRNISADLVGTGEAIANSIKPSSRYLESGDYMKLNNASLFYNLGTIGSIKNASIFVTGNNLLVFTGFTGFDPEVNVNKALNGIPSFGIEYIPYPSARTVILGVKFSL